MKFTIKGELTDLNTYIKMLNSNRWKGNKAKQDETERVAMEARIARLGPIPSDMYPVKILCKWYSKDRRKDVDNCAFSKKFILDGLVKANILENDSRRYVTELGDEFFVDSKDPRVEVEILSIDVIHR